MNDDIMDISLQCNTQFQKNEIYEIFNDMGFVEHFGKFGIHSVELNMKTLKKEITNILQTEVATLIQTKKQKIIRNAIQNTI